MRSCFLPDTFCSNRPFVAGESGCETPTRSGSRVSGEFAQLAPGPGMVALRRSLSGTFGSSNSLAALN